MQDRVRGALGSFLQLLIVAGFLYQYCIGPYVKYVVLAGATCAIPVLFVVMFIFMPETPSYLLSIGKHEEAEKSLMRLRGQSRDAVQEELKGMQVSIIQEANHFKY
ncbi:Facilitated trehalose transporter Tret1 [Blattella germanica]|nr:Facilitated trehalose transporter Tret1 [Blattella germanica]